MHVDKNGNPLQHSRRIHPIVHLLCVSIFVIFLSLITCTIFIGGTLTTIAYLFNYKCIMVNATIIVV